MNKIVVAIDGPAGAGKSTIARIIANRLQILYIDTGAMYRAVTLELLNKNISIEDIDKIEEILKHIKIDIMDDKVFLNNKDVTHEIRQQVINRTVSSVSAIPQVRKKLVDLQREFARNRSVVMDGRDIGTNVLKDADVKVFLTASADERSVRRYKEILLKGLDANLGEIKNEILARDELDSTRALNPLKKAHDAAVVDTTGKDIEMVVEEILKIIKPKL
ncbi:cytidylate kinase [Oxobacter pfennigii]|uniref:Cytidylate kinase n=1 Tax=Oxobacter pfennigii TaxID=36849 RepID=A0A0P8W848_9CLOT|nr:(d)CMP kinase [Oxobacter pfennigii]KPU44857.1 cytidylate kinase [Oxobacter pfennigii]